MTWPIVPLGHVAETTLGKMLDKGKTRGHPHVPYLRNVNVQWGRIDTHDLLTMELAEADRDRFAVRAGDLLVCEGGEIGRCAIWHGQTEYLAFQKALHRVRPGQALEARFLRYVLEHHAQTGQLTKLATGSTIAHLPQQQLRRVPVPLPPLDEQRRIVDLLEDHFSRLDAADSAIEAARLRQEALWLSSLTAIRQSLVDSPTKAIGAIATTSLGKMLDAKKQTGTPTPYLRNINVRWGSFELKDVQLTPLTDDDVARFNVSSGDVLVCEGGEPGRCAVWREPIKGIAFQKALHRIRVGNPDDVLPEFLCLMLTEAIRSGRLSRLFTGTTIKHLPQEKLRMIELPIPTLAQQEVAVARAGELTAARLRLSRATDAAQKRSFALRRALLAAAFSGRITDEPDVHDTREELA